MQREFKISLSQEYYSDVVYLSQYDDDYDVIFHVTNKYSAADVGGKSAKFTGTRTDGLGFTFNAVAVGSSVSFHINTSLTACAGTHTAEIIFYNNDGLYFGSANVQVIVEKAAHPEGTIDADEEQLRELAEQVQEIVDTAAAEVKGEAESWAVGERDGVPVPSTDPTYQNNAKYYAQQAAQTAEEISGVTDQVATNTSDISDLKEDLLEADIYDLRRDLNYYSANWNDITFTWDKAQSKCTITGTATAVTYNNIFISASSLPTNIQAGDVLRVKYKASNVYLIFYDYSGGNLSLIKEVKRDCIVKIPDTCTGLIIRLWIGNGTTVNETVSPEIYKNDNFLIESVDIATESESGKTDMRYIIQEMLDIYGYCKLSPGSFYISGTVNIQEGGTLEGCGESTQIYLTSGNSKAAIQLRRYGAVRNLSLIGSYTDLTESDFGASAGSRYGIQYYKGSSDPWISAYCSISNVHIRNFTAAGIYQYGTGSNVEQGLFVSDVHIKNCWCGIWIYSNSEFCRYSNVQITYCYIACINNGGNNSFNNCVFHAYAVGMKIDGTQNNAAHGMCSNSSFCHIGNNSGSAVTLSDIAHGYVFSACQYWYNSIDITNCGGIVFNGCEIGRSAPININGGNAVMFGNCVFMNDVSYPPSINITNNTKVKFTGCYGSVSGDEISA